MLSRECSTSRNHNTKLRHNLSEIRITNDTSTEFCICKTTATNTQATFMNMEHCYIYYKNKVPGVKNSCASVDGWKRVYMQTVQSQMDGAV